MPRKGENIYKLKDGRWEGRYIKSYINGKAKYGYIYAKSYKEAKEKLNIFRNATFDEKKAFSLGVSSALVPFGTIADKWLEALRPNIKESSYIKYSNLLKDYIFPHFKNIPIESISQNDISSFCLEMQYKGGKKGVGLSPKTVMCIISVLKNVFKYAAQYENIIVTDINNITVKQSQQKPLRILSMQEQKNFTIIYCKTYRLLILEYYSAYIQALESERFAHCNGRIFLLKKNIYMYIKQCKEYKV